MFPGLFKKPKEKLLCINKLNNEKLPHDVLNIIKDYAFFNNNSLAFMKKVATKKE